jgi:hypothetical protein
MTTDQELRPVKYAAVRLHDPCGVNRCGRPSIGVASLPGRFVERDGQWLTYEPFADVPVCAIHRVNKYR